MYFQPNCLAFYEKKRYNSGDYTIIKVGVNMNANDFDLDFDFEKEYGSDAPKDESAQSVEDEFDLKSILGSKFTEKSELIQPDTE